MNFSWYKYFNYGTVIVVAILLLLIVVDVVPSEMKVPFLIVTIIIFVLRIIARVFVTVKSRKEN